MRLRLGYVDDNDEYDIPSASERRSSGASDAPDHADPFGVQFVVPAKPRLRAPSDDETSDSSDLDSDLESDHGAHGGAFGLFEPAEAVPTLSDVSRQDLLRRVERSCEKRALNAVTSSIAYMSLCDTLKHARSDAERQLDAQREDPIDSSLSSAFRRHVEIEARSKRELDQLHRRERTAFEQVEKALAKYQKEQEEMTRAEQEEKNRQEEALRKQQEARRQQQKLMEEKANAEAAERKAKEEEERKKKDDSEKAAAEQAEKKRVEEERLKKQNDAREAAQKLSKEYIDAAEERRRRLDAIQAVAHEISDSPDLAIKNLRIDIKRQAGACNQITAAPSAIRNVVDKIHALLQTAKNYNENVFKYALDLIANNLTKQARVILEYKACYPLAHVIMMSCVRTPELTDVILAHFNKMCIYTIPQFLKKTQSQSVKEYKMAIGFEEAIDKEGAGDDGLEHVTVFTKRMTMVSAVLAATMQTSPWDGSPQPAGLTIGDCWTWLARISNDEADLLTGSLLLTILEVAGFELSRTYKKQFHKVLVLIARQIGPRLSKNARAGAANAAGQLEIFITEYEQNGCQIAEPAARKLEETKVSPDDEDKTENNSGGGGGYGGRGNYGGGRGGRGGGRGRGRGRY